MRRRGGVQPWCQFRCLHPETAHHIFVCYHRFAEMREQAVRGFCDATSRLTRQPSTTREAHLQPTLCAGGNGEDHLGVLQPWPVGHSHIRREAGPQGPQADYSIVCHRVTEDRVLHAHFKMTNNSNTLCTSPIRR